MKNINLIPVNYKYKYKFKKLVYKIVAIEATIFLFTILLVIIVINTLNNKRYEFNSINSLIEDNRFIESNNIVEMIIRKEKEIQVFNQITALSEREISYEKSINIVMDNILDGMEIIEIAYNSYFGQVVVITQVEDKNVIPIFIDILNNTGMFNTIYILNANNNTQGTIFTIEMSTNNSKG